MVAEVYKLSTVIWDLPLWQLLVAVTVCKFLPLEEPYFTFYRPHTITKVKYRFDIQTIILRSDTFLESSLSCGYLLKSIRWLHNQNFLWLVIRIYFYFSFYFPEVPQACLRKLTLQKSHSYTWTNTQLMTDLIISFTLQCGIFIPTATAAFHKISYYVCSRILSVLYDMCQIFSSYFAKSETTCHTHKIV